MTYKTLGDSLIKVDPTGRLYTDFHERLSRYHHDCALLGLAVTTEDPRTIHFREAVQMSYAGLVANIKEVNARFREQVPPIKDLLIDKSSVDKLVLEVLTDLFNGRKR